MGSGKVYAVCYEIDQSVNVDAGLVFFKNSVFYGEPNHVF